MHITFLCLKLNMMTLTFLHYNYTRFVHARAEIYIQPNTTNTADLSCDMEWCIAIHQFIRHVDVTIRIEDQAQQ